MKRTQGGTLRNLISWKQMSVKTFFQLLIIDYYHVFVPVSMNTGKTRTFKLVCNSHVYSVQYIWSCDKNAVEQVLESTLIAAEILLK